MIGFDQVFQCSSSPVRTSFKVLDLDGWKIDGSCFYSKEKLWKVKSEWQHSWLWSNYEAISQFLYLFTDGGGVFKMLGRFVGFY